MVEVVVVEYQLVDAVLGEEGGELAAGQAVAVPAVLSRECSRGTTNRTSGMKTARFLRVRWTKLRIWHDSSYALAIPNER